MSKKGLGAMNKQNSITIFEIAVNNIHKTEEYADDIRDIWEEIFSVFECRGYEINLEITNAIEPKEKTGIRGDVSWLKVFSDGYAEGHQKGFLHGMSAISKELRAKGIEL